MLSSLSPPSLSLAPSLPVGGGGSRWQRAGRRQGKIQCWLIRSLFPSLSLSFFSRSLSLSISISSYISSLPRLSLSLSIYLFSLYLSIFSLSLTSYLAPSSHSHSRSCSLYLSLLSSLSPPSLSLALSLLMSLCLSLSRARISSWAAAYHMTQKRWQIWWRRQRWGIYLLRSLCLYRSASLSQPFLSVSVARFVSLSMFLCLNLSFSFVSSFSSLGGGAVGGRAA